MELQEVKAMRRARVRSFCMVWFVLALHKRSSGDESFLSACYYSHVIDWDNIRNGVRVDVFRKCACIFVSGD